jgi:transposase
MAKRISDDNRERIINGYNNQKTFTEMAELFCCDRTTIGRVVSTYLTEGRVGSRPCGGYKPNKLSDEHKDAIRAYIAEDCTISLETIRVRLIDNFSITVSVPTIHRAIDEFSYSLKNVTRIPEHRNDKATIETRYRYSREYLYLLTKYNESQIFFLDEVGFKVSMRSRRGRSPKGRRAVQTVPNIRSRNISVCCTMSKNGTYFYKKQGRAYNTETFGEYVNELLQRFEDDGLEKVVLIMDNVRFHHNDEIKQKIIDKCHYLGFLPPYSPFLNPIENMFSEWKQAVRRCRPENETQLLSLIDSGFEKISDVNCSNYYKNMMEMIYKCLEKEAIVEE